ncbi:DUF3887 domain-containing protein [Leptothermofonsia sichuanensis E412]|uniref:DUF3887 domain-containing protein n=1 Tax=Leptothermofonsia sichuanensis TaxID=2917832 RepID=UPI001CA65470|nr:DUF3887 domain-containing protein [Leptothermofonsia sichuanensis]QZZ18702.1 DUF3887 domain-containing protein [Leptothermofonsia sichuanensis E412]
MMKHRMKQGQWFVSIGLVVAIACFGVADHARANRRVTQETLQRMRAESQRQRVINNLRSTASRVVRLMAEGRFAEASQTFDQSLQQTLPPEKLRQTWQRLTAEVGPFKQQLGNRTELINNQRSVLVTCEFENGRNDIRLTFDRNQNVVDLLIIPHN